jgi:NAD(P)-dependent dehydrogenase (short-subunit alcohol dehydrogenase family)
MDEEEAIIGPGHRADGTELRQPPGSCRDCSATSTASKGAVIHLTKSVAMELAEDSVRMNAIAPGNVATPLASGKPISAAGKEA